MLEQAGALSEFLSVFQWLKRNFLYRPISLKLPIDKRWLFRECVHTQIKRAYELSVCSRASAFQPDYRVGGCARLIGATFQNSSVE
jgi:hypothetical protein